MKNHYNPIQILNTLAFGMKNINHQYNFLKEVIKKYSHEQVEELIPEIIQAYANSEQFKDVVLNKEQKVTLNTQQAKQSQEESMSNISKEARYYLDKFRVGFKQKFMLQEFQFIKLQENIDNQREIKIQRQNKEVQQFNCQCGKKYSTKAGQHNHLQIHKTQKCSFNVCQNEKPAPDKAKKGKPIKKAKKSKKKKEGQESNNSSEPYDSLY